MYPAGYQYKGRALATLGVAVHPSRTVPTNNMT